MNNQFSIIFIFKLSPQKEKIDSGSFSYRYSDESNMSNSSAHGFAQLFLSMLLLVHIYNFHLYCVFIQNNVQVLKKIVIS